MSYITMQTKDKKQRSKKKALLFRKATSMEKAQDIVSKIQKSALTLDQFVIKAKQLSVILEEDHSFAYKQNYLEKFLSFINQSVSDVSFQQQKLLNGDAGTKAYSSEKNFIFIEGFSSAMASSKEGFAVEVLQTPSYAFVKGGIPLSLASLHEEETLSLRINNSTHHFSITKKSTISSFLEDLRIWLRPFNLIATLEQNLLSLRSLESGSHIYFAVCSQNTSLLSLSPNVWQESLPANDLLVNIENCRFVGKGAFLSLPDSSPVGALILFYNSSFLPKTSPSFLYVFQNSLACPEFDFYVSLPCIHTSSLAVGVPNLSGFPALDHIVIDSEQALFDASLLLYSTISYFSLTSSFLASLSSRLTSLVLNSLPKLSSPKVSIASMAAFISHSS